MNDNNEMIKKVTAIFMSILLSAMLLAGCSGLAVSGKTNSDYKGQMIFGEVTKVSGDSITIEVSTMEKPDDGDQKKDNNTDQSQQDTTKSEKDSTAEIATIKVDSDTKITENQSGGPGGQGGPGNSSAPQGQPPQDSSAPQGQPPEMNNSDSNNSGTEIKLSDIDKGDKVVVTIDDDGDTESIDVMQDNGSENGPNGNGGSNNANVEYTAVKTYESDTSVSGETVKSTGTDENAVLVKGGSVVFDDMTITRDSDSSSNGDNASFYGLSAAVLGTDGTTKVTNSNITTDAEGGAGIFAYGDATVYASDTTIKTTKGSSGGIHAAGGGTLYAWGLDVTTAGRSSAAIRSDRGGGKMVIDGGTYTSTGNGSPAIYSTADITVHDAKLTAKGSEAICIEGKNQIRLFDTNLTGNMSDDEQNDCTWNVILYQSMSGDSEEGTSEFEMNGGNLTARNGGMF